MDPLDAIAVVLVGVASGVLSGMFGVGGAVITTPGVRVLGATPIEAVGSTIPAILPSAASGTLRAGTLITCRPKRAPRASTPPPRWSW